MIQSKSLFLRGVAEIFLHTVQYNRHQCRWTQTMQLMMNSNTFFPCVAAYILAAVVPKICMGNFHTKWGCFRGKMSFKTGRQWSFIMHFLDRSTRILAGDFANFKHSNTPLVCSTYCKSHGFHLAGVENSIECFCGNGLSGAIVTLQEDIKCTYQCPGNASEHCGGGWAVMIYSLSNW